MSVNLSFPGLVDIRQPIAGDSFGWAGLEPVAAKKSIVFHHSGAANAPGEDGFSIAEYHVNRNNWFGIGYHFVITRSDYPGRPGHTNPGAQVQYVGDLGTWRAHVLDQNPGRVGVCFAGMEPDEGQLRLMRQLMDYFVAPNNILPSINYGNQATVHQLVPGQSTECPGATFHTWLPYVQGGAWPYAAPTPPSPQLPTESVPVEVAPPPETPEEGKGGATPIPVTVVPEYVATYRVQPDKKVIARPGAEAIDAVSGTVVVASIPAGQVVDIAGYFDLNGHVYARSVYSATHDKWNGVHTSFFEQATGQPSGDIPIDHPYEATPAPDPIIIPDEVTSGVTDEQLQAALAPEPSKLSFWQYIKEVVASVVARFIKRKIV